MKIISRKEATDNSKCPSCGSEDISYKPSGCMCRIPNHSCWDHPVCNSCSYTAGPSAGNSQEGIWIPFYSLGVAETYEIEV